MSEAFIPVDLFNPGQVFACLGFLEASEQLDGDAEASFDWSDESGVRFRLRSAGTDNPFRVVLDFMSTARIYSEAPDGSEHDTTKWDVLTVSLSPGGPFPFPNPLSPATLPVILEGTSASSSTLPRRIAIDHWGDETCRDNLKFWGGAGGYPAAALARDALSLVRDRCTEAATDPFAISAEQSSSFRFDWRRDYIPIDAGFSLNRHTSTIVTVGFPIVELLAALGLGNARPERISNLEYRYGVIGHSPTDRMMGRLQAFFGPAFLRASLGSSSLPFRRRAFRMNLGWPAKEGQARCITTVTEETSQWLARRH